jgi:nudix-type nucleoside diphosphatase (YffH/AdpP family)
MVLNLTLLSHEKPMKVEIFKKEQLYKGFFTLHRANLSFERYNGAMSRPVTRLAIERGDAVAVLAYDSFRKKIIFVKQFRFPLYLVEPRQGWVLEVPAGAIDHDHEPDETAIREIEEEIGYVVQKEQLRFLTICYPSPGGLTERIHLYLLDVREEQKIHSGGGLEEEAEDIKVVELGYEETFAMVRSGEICDAKSLICLLWFQKEILSSAGV